MTRMTRRRRASTEWLGALILLLVAPKATIMAPLAAPARAAEEAKARTPVVLKGVVVARGTMAPLRYKVEGDGHLIRGAPKFDLSTSIPITQLASARPVVVLASPKGEISLQITQELSIKDKIVVPYTITGGTGSYERTAGSGRIKIDLISRSGLNGTVKLTFVGPAPAAEPRAVAK